MWIRDGVLVNRMHVNPVAFAAAYWRFADKSKRSHLRLIDLINFGFAKSGFSCAEKMALFNSECGDACLADDLIGSASDFYNQVATLAAQSCNYFTGALELIKDLQETGVSNFITSAVEQPVLDAWLRSESGGAAAPYLTEVLGKRENFTKGKDHFAYVAGQIVAGQIGAGQSDAGQSDAGQRIVYVADAVSEIAAGAAFSQQFNVVPIGFGYCITAENVVSAARLVQDALADLPQLDSHEMYEISGLLAHLEETEVSLPDAAQINAALRAAGAFDVAMGGSDQIMTDLKKLLVARLV